MWGLWWGEAFPHTTTSTSFGHKSPCQIPLEAMAHTNVHHLPFCWRVSHPKSMLSWACPIRWMVSTCFHIWLVVSTHLKNISQLGWLFQIYGKIKNVPNHQPGLIFISTNGMLEYGRVTAPANIVAPPFSPWSSIVQTEVNLVGGFNPSENILFNLDDDSQYMVKACSKPPTCS